MKVVLKNRFASDILTVTEGGIGAVIHTQCCIYIKDMSTNVIHFTKHMNMLIQAMDTPEVSFALPSETSSHGGKLS